MALPDAEVAGSGGGDSPPLPFGLAIPPLRLKQAGQLAAGGVLGVGATAQDMLGLLRPRLAPEPAR